jgi:hypothetical protein
MRKNESTALVQVHTTVAERNLGKQHYDASVVRSNQETVDNVSSWVAHVLQYGTAGAAAEMAVLRRENQAELLIYDNAILPLDMPAVRIRGYFWGIWRTNYVPATRHLGLQGALFFNINDWTAGDPWLSPMVRCCCCNASFGPRMVAGWNQLLYPGTGPGAAEQELVPLSSSIRWELLRKGLEDAEYFFMLDRLVTSAKDRTTESDGGDCPTLILSAETALGRVGEVVWGFPRMNQFDASCPYSTNSSLLHDVQEGVARSIEQLVARPDCTASNLSINERGAHKTDDVYDYEVIYEGRTGLPLLGGPPVHSTIPTIVPLVKSKLKNDDHALLDAVTPRWKIEQVDDDKASPPCSCGKFCRPLSPQPKYAREVVAYHTGRDGGVLGTTGDGAAWGTYDFTKTTAIALFTAVQPKLLCRAHQHGVRVLDWTNFVGSQNSNPDNEPDMLTDPKKISTWVDKSVGTTVADIEKCTLPPWARSAAGYQRPLARG